MPNIASDHKALLQLRPVDTLMYFVHASMTALKYPIK